MFYQDSGAAATAGRAEQAEGLTVPAPWVASAAMQNLLSVLGVVVVLAVCLWLLFRSGSMSDRTERDDALGLAPEDPGTEDDQH